MRLFFAGTPQFAVPSLEAVAREHDVCGVLTNPDRPAGRGKGIKHSPVKEKALALELKLFQPQKLDEEFINEVKGLAPELLLVVAYGSIFRENFLSIFPKGGINLHPSLLPRYRGPSPIPAVILAGEKETGITIQKLALKMDAGDILKQEKYPLTGQETCASLSDFLSLKGAELMLFALRELESGKIRFVPQDENQASFCKLVHKEDGRINWQNSALYIQRMIRAYHPWPGVYTTFEGTILFFHQGYVYANQFFTEEKITGKVLGVDKQHGILINTTDGVLCVQTLQLEFKKPQGFREFLNGHKNLVGSTLGG
jgi:methionyl-tRNA formyltransferase